MSRKKKPSIAEQIGSLWTDLAKNMPPPSFGAQVSALGGLAPRSADLHRRMERDRVQSMAQMQQQQSAMNQWVQNLQNPPASAPPPLDPRRFQQPFPVDLNFGGKQSIQEKFQHPPPVGHQQRVYKGMKLEWRVSERRMQRHGVSKEEMRDLGYEPCVDMLAWERPGARGAREAKECDGSPIPNRPETPLEWLDRRVDEIVRLVA